MMQIEDDDNIMWYSYGKRQEALNIFRRFLKDRKLNALYFWLDEYDLIMKKAKKMKKAIGFNRKSYDILDNFPNDEVPILV